MDAATRKPRTKPLDRAGVPTIRRQLLDRIEADGRGRVYTSKDFLNFGGRAAVDQALARLAKEGVLRRLDRGLYDYPRINPALGGPLSPDYELVAQAVARKTGSRLQASGALAANLLGLSTQVPARRVYLTDGASRTIKVGNQVLVFRHAAPRQMQACGTVSGTVFQALRYLGSKAMDENTLRRLRQTLSDQDKQALVRDARYVTDWIHGAVQQIAQGS
jgi:hypothetical protein